MEHTVYSNKIRDPRSQSVHHHHTWFVCKKINDNWHIVQGESTPERAIESMNIMAEHDLLYGHITDIHAWQVFKKDRCEVKTSL